MSEPTYRIAQALHARRAAVGLPKYGQHLTADSPGCMLVHALEESADKTNYLIAEVQRRREVIKTLCDLKAIHGGMVPDNDTVATIQYVIDLLGGETALARYDEILGTVAENATVAPDQRDEALRVATDALEKQRRGMENIIEFRQLRTAIGEEERFGALTRSEIEEVIQQLDGYLAAIRGAR